MHRSLYDAFCQTASEHANQAAWVTHDGLSPQTIRWHEFQQHVDRLALWLSKSGIQPSDRIVNLESNSHRWAILDLATAAIGAIHSPIDPRWSNRQIDQAIESLEPKAVFSTPTNHRPNTLRAPTLTLSIQQAIQKATQLPSNHLARTWQNTERLNQTANILWTSGTSGAPKGVMLSHNNLLSNAMAKLDAMPQRSDDLRLNLLPFAHAYARTCELSAWILSGCAMACAPSSQTLIGAAQMLHPTLINAVPSVYEFLLKKEDAPLLSMLGGRVRQLASGGAAISDTIRKRFAEESMQIFQGYGLTEASPVVCSNRTSIPQSNHQKKPLLEGVGPPVQNVELRVDKDLRLWVKGPGVMQGYWRNETSTQDKIRNGWLDTGDCVACDQIQNTDFHDRSQPIRIAGRADDMQVLSTGHKFAPRLLEYPIEELQGVLQCVVLGTGLRRPMVIVNVEELSQCDTQRLTDQIRNSLGQLPSYMQIAQVILTDEPWTTENGLRHWKGGVNRTEIARRFAPK